MRPSRVFLVALLVCGSVACRRTPATTPLDLALAELDDDYTRRGGDAWKDGLDRLDAMLDADRERPGVQWRRARALIGRGMAQHEDHRAREFYAEARAVASQCLDSDPMFRARRQAVGIVRALPSVGPERRPCVDQLAWAWLRWLAIMGADRAGLDLPTIQALVETNADKHSAEWGRALLLALTGRRGPAKSAFERLLGARWGELHMTADMVQYVLVPEGLTEEAQALVRTLEVQARAESPEEVAALIRAKRALKESGS